MRAAAQAVEAELGLIVPERAHDGLGRLHAAMRYALLGGGKRLRPFLVIESARLFDAPGAGALRVAAAIEMVHCYSLVHDDLPAMDDDDFRRGRPTAHIAFDQATAILAGDGLLTLAFEVLADPATDADAACRCLLVQRLAQAAGMAGMVGGQMIDLGAGRRSLGIGEIRELQALKTGALIGFACEAGALLGRASAAERQALLDYASDLGLAFQIADDLLDVEGDAKLVGKGVGKDAAAGKATFVGVLGVEGARREARRLGQSAAERLAPFGGRADRLAAVAAFVVERKH